MEFWALDGGLGTLYRTGFWVQDEGSQIEFWDLVMRVYAPDIGLGPGKEVWGKDGRLCPGGRAGLWDEHLGPEWGSGW